MAHLNCTRLTWPALLILIGFLSWSDTASATDYFVTIGGGYVPEQNQASLEANVIFFQSVLDKTYPGKYSHDIFFADGADAEADLQVLAPKGPSKLPATDFLASLHRRGGPPDAKVEYRNHRVPQCCGKTSPDGIHAAISRIAKTAKTGDRLLVYVTAHGGEGPEDDPRNTNITCWDDQEITVREFAKWLDELPADLPVVLVMAQCYCGGFANTIFNDPKTREALSPKNRIGFFAQQFDLPAAGCRPDIEHDQEFSSYFWGAMLGHSRNGDPMPGADANKDGSVSFDEAFAHSVIVGETIDIPLKSTDILLRRFSRIPDYVLLRERTRRGPPPKESPESVEPGTDKAAADKDTTEKPTAESPAEKTIAKPEEDLPARMSGPLRDLLRDASPTTRRIVVELSQQLGLTLDSSVDDLQKAFEQHLQGPSDRPPQRGPGGRRGGRQALLAEIAEKWPDLANPEEWKKSPLLKPEDQPALLKEIQQLSSYAAYEQRRLAREEQAKQAELHELKEVKYRRLIDTLENLVLAQNLPAAAPKEVTARYQTLLRLEQMSLGKR
jgi:hypothetical protein